MILGPRILLKFVKEKGLVTNLSERELTKPEGAGFDLRLGEVYTISGKGFLGIEDRQTPEPKLVASFKEGEKKTITVKPGEFYLVKTIESVKLPDDITAHLWPRSTLFRSGLNLLCTQIAPGYEGELTMGLINNSSVDMDIELGARIVHVQFEEVVGKGNMYRGQWKGGRVAATKREKQV